MWDDRPVNDSLDLISVDPRIHHGQACVRGTRVPVTVVLACLADGMTEAEIAEEYPTLPGGAIAAALAYSGWR